VSDTAQLHAIDVWRFAPARRFLIANFLLFGGVSLQAAALGKHVFDITGNELDIGWIGLAEFLPAASLVLVTGSVADRFDRRRVAAVAIFVEVCASLALMAYALTDPTTTWPFFAIAVLYGVGRAFQAPATRTMPPLIAPDGGLAPTMALYSASWTTATIIGPAVSGLFYAIDPWVAYAASSVMVIAGWAGISTTRFVRPQQPVSADERPSLHSAMEGLRFVRRTPVLLAAISLDLFAVLFGGAVALLPVIAEERLGVGDVAYGWLRAAPGLGAAAVAILLAVRPVRRRVGRTLLIAVGVFGAGTVVLGLTSSYVVAFAALLVLSGADMVSVFIRSTLVPLVTPDEKRGRVVAVENVFIGASNELGAFESGVVASLVGTPATVIGGGIATLVIVGGYSVVFPVLRRIDRFDDVMVSAT
jgi:MFS family permease